MGLVAKVKELTHLSDEGALWLTNHLKHYTFKKNELALQEGKTCNDLYYLNSGLMGGYYNVDGQEICNWIAAEGDFATSYYSFISRTTSYESIVCFENTSVQAISYEHLLELYRLFPETERAGRLILEEYYSRLEERLLSIQFKSAKERYWQLFQQRPHIVRRAPLGRIATYLGMKQETLSRIRSEK